MKRQRVVFFLLWALSLVSISFYGGAVSYGFFWAMTLLPVLLALYLLYVYWQFLIYQEVNIKHIVCGEAVPYYFVLQNDGWITFSGISVHMYSDFSYVEDMPDQIQYELLPGDRLRYETKLTCRYRGEYQIGVREIVITDFLHLFRLTYKLPSPVKTRVYPRVMKMNELKSIPEITAYLQNQSYAQQTEPDAAVRDYVPGDPVRRIHWKATAREQKCKVRLYTGEEKQGIGILCDTRRISEECTRFLPAENRILEVLLALGHYFAAGGTRLRVMYRQRELKLLTVDGMASFDTLYREASELMFDKDFLFPATLENVLERGVGAECKALFFVVQEIGEEMFQKAQKLAAGGMVVVIYCITDRDISKYVRMGSLRLKIIAVPADGELEDVL